ncbi:hypothetical protein ACFVW8_25295 [Streptomyces sp. NPDC058221]
MSSRRTFCLPGAEMLPLSVNRWIMRGASEAVRRIAVGIGACAALL